MKSHDTTGLILVAATGVLLTRTIGALSAESSYDSVQIISYVQGSEFKWKHLNIYLRGCFCLCVFPLLDPGWGALGACVRRLRAPGRGWGAVVVSAAAVLLLAALGLALVLILQREFLTLRRHRSL